MGNIKQMDIKNHTYYFFNDMISIKDFDSSLLKKDKKNHIKTLTFTILEQYNKKIDNYENIKSVNSLCLIIDKTDGYIEEKYRDNYSLFTSSDGNKKVLAKFTKFWDEIKHLIETINEGTKGEYEKDFMKVKFNSDDNLPLNKILKLHMSTVIVRSTFEEDDKYYPQAFLDECLYEV